MFIREISPKYLERLPNDKLSSIVKPWFSNHRTGTHFLGPAPILAAGQSRVVAVFLDCLDIACIIVISPARYDFLQWAVLSLLLVTRSSLANSRTSLIIVVSALIRQPFLTQCWSILGPLIAPTSLLFSLDFQSCTFVSEGWYLGIHHSLLPQDTLSLDLATADKTIGYVGRHLLYLLLASHSFCWTTKSNRTTDTQSQVHQQRWWVCWCLV